MAERKSGGNAPRRPVAVPAPAPRDFFAHIRFLGGFSYRAALPSAVWQGLHKPEHARLFQNRVLSLRVIAMLEKAT
jgi:hypothetical protein